MGVFSVKTKIVFEDGLETVLDQIQKAFVVADPFMVSSGEDLLCHRMYGAGKQALSGLF